MSVVRENDVDCPDRLRRMPCRSDDSYCDKICHNTLQMYSYQTHAHKAPYSEPPSRKPLRSRTTSPLSHSHLSPHSPLPLPLATVPSLPSPSPSPPSSSPQSPLPPPQMTTPQPWALSPSSQLTDHTQMQRHRSTILTEIMTPNNNRSSLLKQHTHEHTRMHPHMRALTHSLTHSLTH